MDCPLVLLIIARLAAKTKPMVAGWMVSLEAVEVAGTWLEISRSRRRYRPEPTRALERGFHGPVTAKMRRPGRALFVLTLPMGYNGGVRLTD